MRCGLFVLTSVWVSIALVFVVVLFALTTDRLVNSPGIAPVDIPGANGGWSGPNNKLRYAPTIGAFFTLAISWVLAWWRQPLLLYICAALMLGWAFIHAGATSVDAREIELARNAFCVGTPCTQDVFVAVAVFDGLCCFAELVVAILLFLMAARSGAARTQDENAEGAEMTPVNNFGDSGKMDEGGLRRTGDSIVMRQMMSRDTRDSETRDAQDALLRIRPVLGINAAWLEGKVFVDSLKPGLPGEVAGVSAGDVIVSMNGSSVANHSDLDSAAAKLLPGQKITLVVTRDGQRKTIPVIVGGQGRTDDEIASLRTRAGEDFVREQETNPVARPSTFPIATHTVSRPPGSTMIPPLPPLQKRSPHKEGARDIVEKERGEVPAIDTTLFDRDPNWRPETGPRKRPRLLHPILRGFFRALGAWHVVHAAMAAGFLYFSINWVQTSYPEGVPPAGCVDANGVLLDWKSLPATGGLQSSCEKYARWKQISSVPWREGVIIYTVLNGVLAIASLIYSVFVWNKLNRLEPKDAKQTLRDMFSGFPKGSFMVSYAWKDEPEFGYFIGALPRRVANFFPNSWLDIENLIPGTPVKETCSQAAQEALFRFAFISESYLKSPNCLVEWEVIRSDPGHCFIFAYPSVTDEFIAELEAQGHMVLRLTDELRDAMTAEWFVDRMLRSRLVKPLFAIQSPAINEHWRPTLRFWAGEGDWMFLTLALPYIIGAIAIIVIDIWIDYHYLFDNLFRGFEGTGILFWLSMALPFLLFCVGLYIMWYLQGTGLKMAKVPDVCYLITFLHTIGMIEPIRVYTNSGEVVESPTMAAFFAAGGAVLVDTPGEAHVKCLLLDTVEEGTYKSEDVDESYVFWTRGGFMSLSDYCKATFGSHIIADKPPDLEFLGCKMLMAILNVPAPSLTVGSLGFKTLFVRRAGTRRERENWWRRNLCCKRRQS